MITLESTVDEVDTDTLQTKLKARNSLHVSAYRYINFNKSKKFIISYSLYLFNQTVKPLKINIKVKNKIKKKTLPNPSKIKQKILEEKTKVSHLISLVTVF